MGRSGSPSAICQAGLLDRCHSRFLHDTNGRAPRRLRHRHGEVPGLRSAPGMATPLALQTEEPLRIAHVLAPGPIGGLERVAIGLSSGLRDAGHDVHLVLLVESASHPLVDEAARRNLPVHPIVLPAHSYAREWLRMRRLLSSLGPHIVHTHGYHGDIVGGMAARSARVPVVSTLHGFTGGGRKNRLYEALQRLCTRHNAATIAVSAPMAAILEPHYPPGRIRMIRNAHSNGAPILERGAAREALGLPQAGLVAGWIGRLSHEKGPDLALEAVALSHRKDFALSIIGAGRQASELLALSRSLGIEDRVRFHGPVPDAGSKIRAFDLLVISSRTEGTPMVLFEAMAAGVPVATTAVGGIPDVVGKEEAHLASPEPRAIAEALDYALGEEESLGRASRARERLHRLFGARQWIQDHLALYRSLAPAPSPAPRTPVATQ
jgi:glycosyltransferase involved in cell wall biosynthesis